MPAYPATVEPGLERGSNGYSYSTDLVSSITCISTPKIQNSCPIVLVIVRNTKAVNNTPKNKRNAFIQMLVVHHFKPRDIVMSRMYVINSLIREVTV